MAKLLDYSNPENSTIDDTTKEMYQKKAKQLMLRASKELNIIDIDERQFIMWLLDNRVLFNKNTYRVYKSAVIFYFTQILKTDIALESAAYLIKFSSELSYKKSTKTSSRKAKYIKDEDLEKIINYIDNNNNKWNFYIKCWILSGILCGLRPIEWKDSEIITHDNKIALKVKNAKNTNGRANGDFRTIMLDGLSEEDVNIHKQHLNNVKNFDKIGQYERFYNDCIVRLNTINKKVFGYRKKNITLYSARHQFAANAKFSNHSKSEVAALMGHAVDSTAAMHYGRKRYGKSMLSVYPIKEQVNSVKQKHKSYSDIENTQKSNLNKK